MCFEHMHQNPIVQAQLWIDDAIAAGYFQANAMSLSTVDVTGQPSSRIVLLKDLSNDGLVFFTNYDSKKGSDLAENSKACGLFYWDQLERQIRVEGSVQKVDAADSDAYFSSRPKASQLGAACSPQSQVIEPGFLQSEFDKLETNYAERDVPRPSNWGGYILQPHTIEFWQGRPSRLHDRLRYCRTENSWQTQVLAP